MLIKINLSSRELHIDYPGLEQVLVWMTSYPGLEFSLDLSSCQLTYDAVLLLARCPNLVEVNLWGNYILDRDYAEQALGENIRLRSLSLDSQFDSISLSSRPIGLRELRIRHALNNQTALAQERADLQREYVEQFKKGMENALQSHAVSLLCARSVFVDRKGSELLREFDLVRRAMAELDTPGFDFGLPRPALAAAPNP